MDDQQTGKPGVPCGMEWVLGMAATDEAFAQALAARRSDALNASGVALAPTDRAVLSAVGPKALEQLVARLDSAMLSAERRAVLVRMAAAAVVTLGGGLAAGLAGCTRKPAEDKYEDPLAGGPASRPKPMKRPAANKEKKPANPFDFKQKPLANPKNDNPFRKGFGDGRQPPSTMRPTTRKEPSLGTTSWSEFDPLPKFQGATGSRPDRPARPHQRLPRPRVFMGGNQVNGPMDTSTARRVLRRRFSSIRSCYLSDTSDPKPTGTLRATLIVGANGKVTYLKLAGTLGHKAVEKCMDKVLRRATFPRYAKASTITVSFHFKVQ